VFYSLIVTGIAQVAFPHQVDDSLNTRNGRSKGSEFIGQTFDDPRYFLSISSNADLDIFIFS
jgi:K+-transporting ATPase ATPase C chain